MKLGSSCIIALICFAGLWTGQHLDGQPQNVSISTAHIPSVPPIAPEFQDGPRLASGINSLQQKSNGSGALNWGMYAGTMQDQVQKALMDRNGPMALNLAAMLQECFFNSQLQAYNSSRGGNTGGDPAIQVERTAYLQEEHRHFSACQTVVGDQQQVRLQLLNVAVDQKVFGAARVSFQSGVRSADVFRLLVHDAREGSLGSLYQVATYNPTLFGIDTDTQSAVRYALKIASTDPLVGRRITQLLEHSEFLAPAFSSQKSSTYDY